MSNQSPVWRSLASRTPGLIAAAFAVGTGGLPSDAYLNQRGQLGYPLHPSVTVEAGVEKCTLSQVALDLAAIRKMLKLSVGELASMFGVSRQRIYDWTRGDQPNPERSSLVSELVSALALHGGKMQAVSSRLGNRKLASGHTIVSGVAAGISPRLLVDELVVELNSERADREALNASLRGRVRKGRGQNDFESVG